MAVVQGCNRTNSKTITTVKKISNNNDNNNHLYKTKLYPDHEHYPKTLFLIMLSERNGNWVFFIITVFVS